MHVATPRIVRVPLIDGPFDGGDIDVILDENGEPPEYRTFQDTGPRDVSVNPAYGPSYRCVTHWYLRDTRPGQHGPIWVFRWHSTDVDDAAA